MVIQLSDLRAVVLQLPNRAVLLVLVYIPYNNKEVLRMPYCLSYCGSMVSDRLEWLIAVGAGFQEIEQKQ